MKQKSASLPSLIVLVLVFIIFLTVHFVDETVFAFIIFGVTMVHIIWTLANKLFRSVSLGESAHICNLALLTISCFALNKSLQIFAQFTPWVYAVLFICFVAMLLDAYVDLPSRIWQGLYGFIITCGCFVAIYFSIILLPLSLVGMFGIIVLGLGIHVFVPAILSVTILVLLFRKRSSRFMLAGALTAVLLTISVLALFFYQIKKANDLLGNENVHMVTSEDRALPKWVYLAQKLPKNKWTEMILLSDFKYELFDDWFMDRGITTQTSLDDRGLHEPLLNIAKLSGYHKIGLSDDERLQLLKTIFNSRHETSRKLWSGEHLTTSQCVTDIKLYPDYRLAYTQKTFFIRNNAPQEWLREEALYTLHLPNDAVVSSMSLWVKGVERKSRLTTKEQADSAYVQIVGVQSRDPSLLHWQEGNRVSVTVFPCTPGEVRILKVGYTTPLRVKNNTLAYDDIFVEGPSFENCRNDIQINSTQSEAAVSSQDLNLSTSGEPLSAHFTGNKPWAINCQKVPLGTAAFAFNQKVFRISEEVSEQHSLNIQHIILDVHSGWTKAEFQQILAQHKDKHLWYAADEQTLQPIGEHADQVWESLHQRNFQLLPFHKIDAGNSVILTKLFPNAPAYRDLTGSTYARWLAASVSSAQQPIYCFDIGSAHRDYLFQTLHDMNYLRLHAMTLDQCLAVLAQGQIAEPIQTPNSLNIDDADINITQVDTGSHQGAPDHLMRMFAYKKILAATGKHFFDNSRIDSLQSAVAMANEAFVVTPVSSLIVLETDKDYEEMGIGENQKSLLNATKKGKGAIPEPHEWVIIGLGVLALFYFIGRQKRIF